MAVDARWWLCRPRRFLAAQRALGFLQFTGSGILKDQVGRLLPMVMADQAAGENEIKLGQIEVVGGQPGQVLDVAAGVVTSEAEDAAANRQTHGALRDYRLIRGQGAE